MSHDLKPETVQRILELYHSKVTVSHINERLHVGTEKIKLVLFEHGLPWDRRYGNNFSARMQTPANHMPSEEEIAAQTKAIRAKWSEHTRQQRCCYPTPEVELYEIETRGNRKGKHEHNLD